MKTKEVEITDNTEISEDGEKNNSEKIIEKILSSYSIFEEVYQGLSNLKAFNSTCIIKIKRIKETFNKHFPFAKMGFLERDLMKGRIDCLNEMLKQLSDFDRDFVLMRYFENKSREFVIKALKIGSVSTYKRIRHEVLENCRAILHSNEDFNNLFNDFYNYVEK